MAQPSTEKGTNGRVIGYSWSEIAAAVNRAIDNVRSENSCRHRWNKIIGRYRPTAQEKRLAESWLGSTDDEQDAGAAGGMEEEGGHEGGQDGGDVAVRECEQKVIVTSDDDMMASDADNDVVEVVSVGADIPPFLPPKPRSRTRVPHPPAGPRRLPLRLPGRDQPARAHRGLQGGVHGRRDRHRRLAAPADAANSLNSSKSHSCESPLNETCTKMVL